MKLEYELVSDIGQSRGILTLSTSGLSSIMGFSQYDVQWPFYGWKFSPDYTYVSFTGESSGGDYTLK